MESFLEQPWRRRHLLRTAALTAAALIGSRARAESLSKPAETTKLTPEQEKQLAAAKFVYIQSTRKDGNLSKPSEIWFAVIDGAVWVGSSPDSWRAKRIRWKRPQARIAIG